MGNIIKTDNEFIMRLIRKIRQAETEDDAFEYAQEISEYSYSLAQRNMGVLLKQEIDKFNVFDEVYLGSKSAKYKQG